MIKDFIFHYGIPLYNLVYESINSIYSELVFYCNNTIKGYNSKTLYFYDNNPNVYLESFIDSTNKINGPIVWKFDMYKRIFYNYKCLEKDIKFMPIICATVTLDDKETINLTDFITSLSIESSNMSYPSLQHILGAYEYTHGIILDRNLPYKLDLLFDDLNNKSVNLFSNINFTN
jgi:hypothetical protein